MTVKPQPPLRKSSSNCTPYDIDADGSEEILALYESGRLAAYGWERRGGLAYQPVEAPAPGIDPLIVIDDFDSDGRR